jgi:hypothetical protein
MVVEDCKEKSGGLAVFWKKEINFHLRDVSRFYIDGDVTESDGFVWRFTGFYGEPRTDQKELSWKALQTLNAARKFPWICAGDFNEILFSHEKEGGQARGQICMDRLRDVLEERSLSDLDFSGDPFTWRNNSHNSDQYIRERLDRAAADTAWRVRFPNVRVINGEPRHSDHRPVKVVMEEEPRWGSSPGAAAFCFEAGWIQEEQCATIVENACNLSTQVRTGNVRDALRQVSTDLWDWSKNSLGDLEKRIKRARRDLEACRKGMLSGQNISREAILRYKLEKLEDQKELYWRQRAHVHWLQEGD